MEIFKKLKKRSYISKDGNLLFNIIDVFQEKKTQEYKIKIFSVDFLEKRIDISIEKIDLETMNLYEDSKYWNKISNIDFAKKIKNKIRTYQSKVEYPRAERIVVNQNILEDRIIVKEKVFLE